jgi:hypothetical protein
MPAAMKFGVRYTQIGSEADVWAAVEREIGTKLAPEERAWCERHTPHVVDAVNARTQQDFDEEFGELLEVVRRVGSPTKQVGHSTEREAGSYIAEFSDQERRMEDARCAYLEAEIGRIPAVIAYRARLPWPRFGNDTAAIDFLESDVARLLTLEQMQKFGVYPAPQPVKTTPDPNGSRYRYDIEVGSREDGSIEHVFRIEYSVADLIRLEHDVAVDHEFVSGSAIRLPERSGRSQDNIGAGDVPPANRRVLARECWPLIEAFRGTAAGTALQIASELSREYYITTADALLVLLTGKLQCRYPVATQETATTIYEEDGESHYLGAGPILLTIQPWVTAETVARIYRSIQRRQFVGDNRPLSARNLRLFSFVCAHKAANRPLRTAYKAWSNEQHADEGTGAETAISSTEFWKIYRRVRSKLFPEHDRSSASFARFRTTKEQRHEGFADLDVESKRALWNTWRAEWTSGRRKSKIRADG